MEDQRGHIRIVWPEDRALQGEDLERLQQRLEPYAEELNSLIPQFLGGAATSEMVEVGERAIIDTLSFFNEPISVRDLHDTITACWNRNDARPAAAPKRSHVINHAALLLVQRGSIAEEDFGVRLSLVGSEKPSPSVG